MIFICAECGKLIENREAMGSMKHPCCEECFTRVWDGEENKYIEWLEQVH